MAEGKERAAARLENLEAIDPLLGSLRVLSLSTMQMALNRLEALDHYSERFNSIAAQLTILFKPTVLKPGVDKTFEFRPPTPKRILAVLGSTRGIAGQYNRQLAREVHAVVEHDDQQSLVVLAFGKRVQATLAQEEIDFDARDGLSTGSIPNYAQVSTLMRGWMQAFGEGRIESMEVISFRQQGQSTDYKPQLTHLLPEVETREAGLAPIALPWPKPIIEGDPRVLLERISDHLIAIKFYKLILEAVAAENLFRYRLLEEAKENTSSLLEELRQSIQVERRKEITQQLQELLVGSGMLVER